MLPYPHSSMLKKPFEVPDDYVGTDGQRHRKPVRALYGFGQSARKRFEGDVATYERYCLDLKTQVERDNLAVDYWTNHAQAGDREAVAWYCREVLPTALVPIVGERPTHVRSAYWVDERRFLVIERRVPGIEVIPTLHHYELRGGGQRPQYVVEVPASERPLWYLTFLAQVALLTLDRLFRSEIAIALDVATLNCITVMLNPATGHQEVIAVLSVKAMKDWFLSLNLAEVEPIACVLDLGGRVTKSPGDYAPVIPIADVGQGEVAAVSLPNTPLLAMSPSEFEHLVTDLLRRMGLRAQNTGRSGDGGVDCEAYDDRPIVGGRVIVQVKRYTNTVSPAVVRDLYGTVHSTGATKGVLVTTSGFGPESREFAYGKPLELIDGTQLDALLREYGLGPGER